MNTRDRRIIIHAPYHGKQEVYSVEAFPRRTLINYGTRP